MVRIVVDAMGSDNFPTPDVEGAVMAAREYEIEIILVGDEAIFFDWSLTDFTETITTIFNFL